MKRFGFLLLAVGLGMARAWAYPCPPCPPLGISASVGYYFPTTTSGVAADGTALHLKGGPCLSSVIFLRGARHHMMGVECTVGTAGASSTYQNNNRYGGFGPGNSFNGYNDDDFGNDITLTRAYLLYRYQPGRHLFLEYGVGVSYVSS